MKRTRSTLLLYLLLAATSVSAKAQVGIYGEFSAAHTPGEPFIGTPTAWYNGFSAGVYDDFLHAGSIKLGLDLRGSYGKANGTSSYNVLFGPRLTAKLPGLPIRPYVQAAVGIGGIGSISPINHNTSTHYSGRLQYGVIGGLDYTIFPHLDLRLPEIGYLRTHADQFSGPAAPVNLITLSAGVVLRFP